MQCCKAIVGRNVGSFEIGDTWQEKRIAFSSPCISIKAIPTASSEIQGEDFFFCCRGLSRKSKMDLIELSYEIEGSAPVLGGSVAFRKWRNDVCDYLAANAVRLKEFKAISFFPSAGIGDMIQTDWNDGAWDHARKCILDFGSANDEVDIKTNGGSK